MKPRGPSLIGFACAVEPAEVALLPLMTRAGKKRRESNPQEGVVAIKIIERTEAGLVVFPYINLNTRRQTQNIKKRKQEIFLIRVNRVQKSNTVIFIEAKFHLVSFGKKKSLMN